LNSIDIILSILLLIGIVRGFIKGFIYEIAVVGAMVVCYFFGFKLADIVAEYIGKIISVNSGTLHYISLLLAWIGISVGIFFLARLFEGLVSVVALGLFNKIAGAVFGGLKYAILISLFLFFLNRFDISTSWFNADLKADSFLYYKLLNISKAIFSSLTNY
jgi:membrane protein required for colicin V production